MNDPSRQRSIDRIVDANLNRAAEGLRVVEDICRYHWNLSGLAGELKSVRHLLLTAGRRPEKLDDFIRARDVEGDVGRAFGVSSDSGRTASSEKIESLATIASCNLQRAREALRSIEEATRSNDRQKAGEFESLRYRLYALEKGIFYLGISKDARRLALQATKLCLLATSGLASIPIVDSVERALEGGVDMVQLREKELPDRELMALALRLREITAAASALLIVNDRADIAMLCGADGVHLGQDDLPPAAARRIVGDDLLIGVSTHSPEQARAAAISGADYLGVGPMFETATKNAGPLLGPEGYEEVAAAVGTTALPLFAIGGIDERRVAALGERGVTRIAVSSAILGSEDPRETARALAKLMGLGRK